jgi:hypothetical protein
MQDFFIFTKKYYMKTLLFLLFPVLFYSQTSFRNLDSASFVSQIDAIIKTTGKDYKFIEKGTEKSFDYLVYNTENDTDDNLLITYYTYMEGDDKNLEIAGVKRWDFRSIRGKYRTLFPIWKKYVEPGADIEKLSKSRYKMKGNYSISELSEPLWLMRF